eukprot:gene354-199_t
MYIDDADWLHSLEEASAAPCHHLLCELQSMSPVSDSLRCSAQIHNQSKSPPARPLKNVTQRANQLLRAFAFSPCSDAEMRVSERMPARSSSSTVSFALQPTDSFYRAFFQVVPLAHCIVDSHVRLFRSRFPQQREDALDEWFLDEPKKTLKGFAPLMPPEWQLARIA